MLTRRAFGALPATNYRCRLGDPFLAQHGVRRKLLGPEKQSRMRTSGIRATKYWCTSSSSVASKVSLCTSTCAPRGRLHNMVASSALIWVPAAPVSIADLPCRASFAVEAEAELSASFSIASQVLQQGAHLSGDDGDSTSVISSKAVAVVLTSMSLEALPSTEETGACRVWTDKAQLLQQLHELRTACPAAFIVLWHADAVEDGALRWNATQAGANMITNCPQHLDLALTRVVQQLSATHIGDLHCHYCGKSDLSAMGMWHHLPLYHCQERPAAGACQICTQFVEDVMSHVHYVHYPKGQEPAPRTGIFALVVVRRPSDQKFLVVQETGNVGYWLPGGGVDPGESLRQGAIRECIEEAGVEPVLEGVLQIDCLRGGRFRRFIFLGRPKDDTQMAKSFPDHESSGACWVHAGDLCHLRQRAPTELQWLTRLSEGAATVWPLAMPNEWQLHFQGVLF